MKHIPILFSTPMVQAILGGRKTQTRRVVKPQPDDNGVDFMPVAPCLDWEQIYNDVWKPWKWDTDEGESISKFCPYGQPGDVLWVRETHANLNVDSVGGVRPYYVYVADLAPSNDYGPVTWKPSIHMPKEASRLFLETIHYKVERVADISEQDAIAEGVQSQYWEEMKSTRYKDYIADASGYGHPDHDFPTVSTAKESFKTLWQKINGKPSPVQEKINGKLKTIAYIVYPFDDDASKEFEGKTTWKGKPLTVIVNPWVWVVTFKQTEKPTDFLNQ